MVARLRDDLVVRSARWIWDTRWRRLTASVRESALRFPLTFPDRQRTGDRIAMRFGRLAPIWCPVCGRLATAAGFAPQVLQLRDSGRCTACGATNRQRQLGAVTCYWASRIIARPVRALAELSALPWPRVYNTEASGPVHEAMKGSTTYIASEYLGPSVRPGTVVDGKRHEDLAGTSIADGVVDLVLTSDVFEHLPDPYAAHREVGRILCPGGVHVFTVPFDQTSLRDDVRAVVHDGEIRHVAEPLYHHDPLRPGVGTLVYTVFGLETLLRLDELGFDPFLYQLHDPLLGIVGPNAIVLAARKR
jgi:hypothetical protein